MVYSSESEPYYGKVVEAHGILGCVAWVIFFPLGAILLRVVPHKGWIVHASVMIFALILFTANVGMGIWQTGTYNTYHQAIGLLLFALVWVQPISGLVHHYLYTKYARRTIVSFLHITIGRAIITLGIVNGGLGMLYADGDATRMELIIYGTIAGVIWVSYFIIAFIAEDKREIAIRQELKTDKIYGE